MQVAPPGHAMRAFPNPEQALDYQVDHGGWVYAVNKNAQAFWYPSSMSALQIMVHPPALHNAGRLIPDPARRPLTTA